MEKLKKVNFVVENEREREFVDEYFELNVTVDSGKTLADNLVSVFKMPVMINSDTANVSPSFNCINSHLSQGHFLHIVPAICSLSRCVAGFEADIRLKKTQPCSSKHN